MSDAYVLDAVRTPFGRYGGALAGVRPDDLAGHALRALLDRSPDLDPALIEDVLWGDANGAGEDNRNVGRMAVLLAGLPTQIPAATVNRLCGSSLEAAIQASRTIECGDASITVVGRRGVDVARAVGAAQARARAPARPRDAALDDAGLADGQPADARAVDDLAGAERREARRHVLDQPRGAGRVRAAQPPERRARVGRGLLRLGGRGSRTPIWSATRASAGTRRWRSWPSSSHRSSRAAR